MIEIQEASVTYPNGVHALHRVNLRVEKGEFVFLVGATGAGKSTLLKLITREVLPSSGKVIVAGRNVADIPPKEVPYYRRMMGVVFQDFGLLPNKTVWENVAFALRVLGLPRREIRKRTAHAIEMVGLLRRCDSFPAQLSGGEAQRVAIARAIANDPPLLLADEPTGNLDPDTSWDIMQLLHHINVRGTTVLVASHDKYVIDQMRKRVVTLDRGVVVSDVPCGVYAP